MAFKNLGLSDALAEGMKGRTDRDYKKAQASNQYVNSLMRQKEYEISNQKQAFDQAKYLLDTISIKFPKGDKDADQQFQVFQGTDEYKEIVKTVKSGLPGFPVAGDIRLPKYEAAKGRIDYEKASLEKRVMDGTASPQDQMRYTKIKAESKMYDTAVALAANNDEFEDMDAQSQIDLINKNLTGLIQAGQPQVSGGQLPQLPEQARVSQALGFSEPDKLTSDQLAVQNSKNNIDPLQLEADYAIKQGADPMAVAQRIALMRKQK